MNKTWPLPVRLALPWEGRDRSLAGTSVECAQRVTDSSIVHWELGGGALCSTRRKEGPGRLGEGAFE